MSPNKISRKAGEKKLADLALALLGARREQVLLGHDAEGGKNLLHVVLLLAEQRLRARGIERKALAR
jgi:hypothetical protein